MFSEAVWALEMRWECVYPLFKYFNCITIISLVVVVVINVVVLQNQVYLVYISENYLKKYIYVNYRLLKSWHMVY